MTESEWVAALSAIPLFEGLSTAELTSIAEPMLERAVRMGDVLIEEGAPGHEAMIIVSGTALVKRHGRVIDEIGKGDFFGEMSLVNHAPRTASVVASSDLRVLVITAEPFFAILEANPTVCVKILRTVAARVAASEDPGTI